MIGKLKKILGLGKKSEVEEETSYDEIEELVAKAERMRREKIDTPWDEFKALCREYGADYRDVISKAAWMYIEETGGTIEDPITKAKEVASALKELNEAIEVATEPESLKKVKMYKDSIQHVAELKKALHELKSEKISATDILAIMKKMGVL